MIFTGYRPTLNKQKSIDVSIIKADNNSEQVRLKGTFYCDYASHGGNCNGNECPIYKAVPSQL